MTKTLIWFITPALALSVMACTPQTTVQTSTSDTLNSPSTSQDFAEGVSLSQIAASWTPGAAYTCAFEGVDNAQKMKYVIQDDKFSVSIDSADAAGSQSRFISDGDMMYMWDTETKQGTKMSALSTKELDNSAVDVPDFNDVEALAELESQYKTSCLPLVVNGTEFVPPSDVQFQDLSSMMETMQQYQAPR